MVFRANQVIAAYIALTAISVAIPYSLSVLFDHVAPFIPYMADLGDQPIESTIFTQCFVIDAAVLMLLVQIRFVYVSFYLEKNQSPRDKHLLNFAATATGYAAAMGLLVLACFQESHAFYFQKIGVCLYFFGSAVYFTFQCILSKAVASTRRDEVVIVSRILLNSFMYLALVIFAGGYAVALNEFTRPWEERVKWGKDDGGWVPHLLSASAEWVLILLFLAYLLTFCHELKKVQLTGTRIIIHAEEDQDDPLPAGS